MQWQSSGHRWKVTRSIWRWKGIVTNGKFAVFSFQTILRLFNFSYAILIRATTRTLLKKELSWNCAAFHCAKRSSASKWTIQLIFWIFTICSYLFRIPAQQFHVSTSTKTVYDLTDRKHFCSGECLRASNYIKIQLLTSPLWMRDNEVIPDFKLLSLN